MAIGVWDPDQGKAQLEESPVDEELLLQFLMVPISGDTISSVDLEAAGVSGESAVMNLDASAWSAAELMAGDEIAHLIRVFTLLEMQVPGWDAGAKSPVIPLVKVLKSRGEFSPELRKWIKASTDNRYLPYGSAL